MCENDIEKLMPVFPKLVHKSGMKLSTLFFTCILLLFLHIHVTLSQSNLDCYNCNSTRGTYTTNSTFHTNLNLVLSTISTTHQIQNRFYNFSVGNGSDQVYGFGLCRFDLSVSDCRTCLGNVAAELPLDCPNQKEAIGYYILYEPPCMLRYSGQPDMSISIIQEDYPYCPSALDDLDPGHYYPIRGPDRKKSNQTIISLLGNLTVQTADDVGDSHPKFATGSADINASLQIYALTQCNPYLSSLDCSNCLKWQITRLPTYFKVAKGACIYGPSCSVEFHTTMFYNLPVIGPSSTAPPVPGKRSRKKKVIWIIVVILIGSFMLLGVLGLLLWRKEKRKTKTELTRKNTKNMINCVDSLKVDYDSIQAATDNFSDANRLGKGTTTRAYKGILPNDQEVAVKRQIKSGKDSELAFNNEVLISANLQHRNLVRLLGFCIEEDEMLLVFEFLPNESLDWFLYDPIKRAQFDWETRHNVILQIARGLLYLHEDSQLRVIHRDLNPSNILLGVNMNPKISNFSRASRVHVDESRGASSKIIGTYGYMPPEYALHGHSSFKSDVFSFGVLLLEIISGQTITNFSDGENEEMLLRFAWRKWSKGEAQDLVDKALMQNNTSDEVLKCIKIALLCIHEDPSRRPNMSTVVFMLNSNINTIPNPSTPGIIVSNDVFGYSELSNQRSLEEASMSRRLQTL